MHDAFAPAIAELQSKTSAGEGESPNAGTTPASTETGSPRAKRQKIEAAGGDEDSSDAAYVADEA